MIKWKKRLFFEVSIAIIILSSIVIVGILQSSNQPLEIAEVNVGSYAPKFELPVLGSGGLTGKKLKLEDLSERIVVVEFMTSFCSECQGLAGVLQNLYGRYWRMGVVVLSVAGTHEGADVDSTTRFVANYAPNLTHLMDYQNEVFRRYHVTKTPTIFIIDKDGKVSKKIEGDVKSETLENGVKELLPR